MEKTKIKAQKTALLNLLEGYKKSNDLATAERGKRLAQLTAKDSIREYDALCKTWEIASKKEGLERLEKQRISLLIKRRRLFDKTGGLGESR